MPWTKSSPPDVAKNKPAEQVEACVLAANRTLDRGGTEEEAIFACVGAMKAVAKSATVNKQNLSVKEARKPPSHFPTAEMFKVLREEQKEEVKKALVLPAFLSKHSLPEGITRNVIAINFDKTGKLVVAFDTGEIITTDAVAIKEIFEQYVSISTGGSSGTTPVPTGNVFYNQFALSGTHFILNKEEHGLDSIIAFYIKDKHHKEVILEVHINHTGRIDIHSLIPMTDMTLHLTGIKS